MMKKIIILFLLLLCSKAEATQILIAHSGSTQAASLTRYMSVQGVASSLYTTDGAASMVMPTDGVIDLLVVRLSGTAGSNRTFTLYKNGSPTALTCVVASTTCSDAVNTVSYSAGDTISMEVVSIASGSTRAQGFSLRFTPTVAKENILMYNSNAANFANGNFVPVLGSTTSNATETNVAMIMPETAQISKMYCRSDAAPGAGTSFIWTSRNNTANGNLVCTIADAATTGSDVVNADNIATAGDPYATVMSVAGAPAVTPFKVSYVYTTPTCGNFILPEGGGGTALSTSAARYFPVNGVATPASGDTLLGTQQVSNAFTIKTLWMRLSAAPRSGKSYAANLLVGGSGSALTNTISDAVVVQAASADVAVSSGDLLSTSVTPASTPASALYKGTYIGNVAADTCGGSRRVGSTS